LSDDPPDSQYPQATDFRQDNDFFYLTGLETRESWLLVSATDSLHGEVQLFIPPRNPVEERWTGPKLGPGPEAATATGLPVENIHSADSVQFFLRRALLQRRGGPVTFWFRHTERDTKPDFVHDVALNASNLVTQDLLPVLGGLRAVKDY